MVVMEEIERPWVVLREVTPRSWTQFREPIEKAIESFHANGYVHGDIRLSNIFVFPEDPSRGIKFIDFDEAGVDGEALYPRNLNTETVRRPPGAVDGEKFTKEHDKFMIKELFVQPYDVVSFTCWAIGS
jgi:serine/threonine protein kinase